MPEQNTPDTTPTSKTSTFREVLTRITHTDRFKDVLFGVAGGLIGIATSYLTRNLNLQSWNLLRCIPSFIKPSHVIASVALIAPGVYKFMSKPSFAAELEAARWETLPDSKFKPDLHRRLWILAASNFVTSFATSQFLK